MLLSAPDRLQRAAIPGREWLSVPDAVELADFEHWNLPYDKGILSPAQSFRRGVPATD